MLDPRLAHKEAPLAPRYYAFAIIRLLIAVSAGAALVAFNIASTSNSFAIRFLGDEYGRTVSSYDVAHQVGGNVVILLAAAFAWACVGRIATSLILGMVLVGGTYYLVATGPAPLAPLEWGCVALSGLIMVGILIGFILPGPPPKDADPWQT